MLIVVVVDSSIVLGSLGFNTDDSRFLQLQLVIKQVAVQRSVLSLQILEQLVELPVVHCITEQCRFLLYQVCHLVVGDFELAFRQFFAVELLLQRFINIFQLRHSCFETSCLGLCLANLPTLALAGTQVDLQQWSYLPALSTSLVQARKPPRHYLLELAI